MQLQSTDLNIDQQLTGNISQSSMNIYIQEAIISRCLTVADLVVIPNLHSIVGEQNEVGWKIK